MVQILDSTLREGEQTPGISFDPHIKLAIARLLDEVGVDFVEAGHPLVSDAIREGVSRLGSAGLRPTVAAHARSLRDDVDAALACGVGLLGVFYCVSSQRLQGVFRTPLEAAVEQISDVIGYAKQRDPDLLVRYTPEDTVRSEFPNVVRAAVAACEAGADIISIADTTGVMVPGTDRNLYDYVGRLREALDAAGVAPRLAVHCHDDRGLALANALDAYRAGIDIIDVAVLGLGERAGIVDLACLMAVLATDFGEGEGEGAGDGAGEGAWRLEVLPELYALVSEYAGAPVPVNAPVVGANAFTHCAGVHTQAAMRNPLHYQSLDPARFGRSTEICLDHMSGMSSVRHALARIGQPDLDDGLVFAVLREVKAVGEKGRVVSEEELAYLVSFLGARTPRPVRVLAGGMG